jgi:hypothetical protein
MKFENSGAELFKGVMLAHLILGLHVVVLFLIGLLVIFFGGIARYWAWILLGGLSLTGLGAFWVYRRLKRQGRNLYGDIRGVSVPAGASLEVSFLGGMASVKFVRPNGSIPKMDTAAPPPLLEDPEVVRVRELAYLAQMYEKNLITREEFERAKGAVFNPAAAQRFGSGRLEN